MTWSQKLASASGLNLLQTLARALFACLALLYFLGSDLPLVEPAIGWSLLAVYLLVQLALLQWRATAGRLLANLIDLLAVTSLVIFDPLATPPTLVLFLMLTLSSGLLFGLRSCSQMLLASTLAIGLALPLHNHMQQAPVTSGSLFLIAALGLCALYFLLLLMRNQLLGRDAQQAAWRNPQTGLISQRALISTAGWLLPLHDRLAATLSLVVLTPDANSSIEQLAETLGQRIRGSDIAAHYSDRLALLLPATGAGSTGVLLQELRATHPHFMAASITLADDKQALEPVLEHLSQSLERARPDSDHWLVHAPQLPPL